MKKITSKTTIKDLAAIVSSTLSEAGITAVLSGGSVVSIYSENQYESYDLDFISTASMKKIEKVMESIGFKRSPNKYFEHEKTQILVEFPSGPLAIGEEPIKKWGKVETDQGVIQLLTPTQCVMDRLSSFYHWNDKQSLDQAVVVAKTIGVNFKKLKDWSAKEGEITKYEEFLQATKQN